MKIYSVNGLEIYETRHATIKQTIEYAACHNIPLLRADLRRVNMRGAKIDGIRLKDACLWGADITGADMAGADLSGVDFRAAFLKNTCLAESNLHLADLRGAQVEGAIVRGANLRGIQFSCPAFFALDLCDASMDGAVYWHRGERATVLSDAPYRLFSHYDTLYYSKKSQKIPGF